MLPFVVLDASVATGILDVKVVSWPSAPVATETAREYRVVAFGPGVIVASLPSIVVTTGVPITPSERVIVTDISDATVVSGYVTAAVDFVTTTGSRYES